MKITQIYRININVFLTVRLSLILVIILFNAENPFYNKFIILLYMFRVLCAHIGKSKLYYTASGIVTTVDSRPVHSPLSNCAPDGHLHI